jgi:hypothetical protein
MLLVGPSKHDLVRLVGGRQRNTSRFSNVPKLIKLMFVLSPDQRLFESRALSSRKFGGRARGQPLQPQFPKTGAAGKSVLFESFKNKQFAFYLVPAQLIKGAPDSPPLSWAVLPQKPKVGLRPRCLEQQTRQGTGR